MLKWHNEADSMAHITEIAPPSTAEFCVNVEDTTVRLLAIKRMAPPPLRYCPVGVVVSNAMLPMNSQSLSTASERQFLMLIAPPPPWCCGFPWLPLLSLLLAELLRSITRARSILLLRTHTRMCARAHREREGERGREREIEREREREREILYNTREGSG